jgi:hypothetical protein
VIEILKSFMVRIVRDFEIKTNEDTVWKEHPGIHFILKLDPIYLDFILRKGQRINSNTLNITGTK